MSDRLPAPAALRKLRERAGLSVRSLAAALGDKPSSTYASYERTTFKKPYLPMNLVQALRPILAGRGAPPITEAEILALAGVDPSSGTPSASAQPPSTPARPVRSTTPVPPGTSVPTVAVPQVDIEAAAGPGAAVPEVLGQNGHAVVATWDIAAEFARSVASRPDALVVVQVRGRSMEPIFRHGDYVFVDTEQRQIHGGDAYVFWDGAALVVKQLEVMAGTAPLRVRILSRNPDFPPYEAPAADLHVSGRVVGMLSRW